MTQNPSNNVSISGPLVVRILDEANGYLDEHRAEIANLKEELSNANVKIAMHEALWKSAQQVLGERNEEIISLEKQVQLYKQEFSDASNQHLSALNVIQAIKAGLKNTLDSIDKMEIK